MVFHTCCLILLTFYFFVPLPAFMNTLTFYVFGPLPAFMNTNRGPKPCRREVSVGMGNENPNECGNSRETFRFEKVHLAFSLHFTVVLSSVIRDVISQCITYGGITYVHQYYLDGSRYSPCVYNGIWHAPLQDGTVPGGCSSGEKGQSGAGSWNL